MLLRIVHQTHYRYDPPVVMAQHLAHLTPPALPGQEVQSHRLAIIPEQAVPTPSTDVFGNQRQFFTLQSPHGELSVTADSVVSTSPPGPLPASPTWEAVREQFTYSAGATYDAAGEFCFASPYVPRHATLAEFAREVVEPDMPILDAAQALMTHIHTEMTYEGGSTHLDTPVLEALAQRKGVCQDFAHLMIGCLRSLGLPARYVSGYLLTHPPAGKPRLIGADASHAWVQVYAPGEGWADFDPTNDHSGWGRPGEDYVTLAIGRDFGDVSPLRGVIQGGGAPLLTVSVTVAPPEELKGTALDPTAKPTAATPAAAQPAPAATSDEAEPTEAQADPGATDATDATDGDLADGEENDAVDHSGERTGRGDGDSDGDGSSEATAASPITKIQ